MAVQVQKLFDLVQLGTVAATLYTVPASPATIVLQNGRVRIANTTTAAVAATLYAVPSGGSAAPANQFLPGEAIAGNSHVDVDIPQLGPGGFIQGLAGTASALTVGPLSGVLFS